MPHMHVRGKAMKYELVYPGGARQTLLYVPRYSFHQQTLYTLKRPLEVPSGSRLIMTAHFDNSERNMHNPDPTKTIRHASATFDEMMIGFVNYIIPKPPDRLVIRVDAGLYDAYVGRYEFDAARALLVTKSGARLFLEAGGRRVELLPISETTFITKDSDQQLTFVKDERGEVIGFTTVNNDKVVRFKKVPAMNGRSRQCSNSPDCEQHGSYRELGWSPGRVRGAPMPALGDGGGHGRQRRGTCDAGSAGNPADEERQARR